MGKVIDDVNVTFLALPGAIRLIVGRPVIDFFLRRAVGKKEHLRFFELFCNSSARLAAELSVSGTSLITISAADSAAVGSVEETKALMTLQLEIDEILSVSTFSPAVSYSLNCRSRQGFRSNGSLHTSFPSSKEKNNWTDNHTGWMNTTCAGGALR